ncbi:16875_t:CDS:2, partial [Gigaspora rosea]
ELGLGIVEAKIEVMSTWTDSKDSPWASTEDWENNATVLQSSLKDNQAIK